MKKSFFTYLLIMLGAALAAFFAYFPITDTDIFWHLAAGREMIRSGHFLFSDPFSFTLQSPQWIDLHWLFQLLAYGLFTLGGLKAIIAFKLIVVFCVSALLCLTFRSAIYRSICAILTPLLFYQTRYLILDRPVLITMLCMALYIFLFERVKQGLSRHWLWICIPLQMIWTNSQGLFPIGLFIIGVYWFECVIIRYGEKFSRYGKLKTAYDVAIGPVDHTAAQYPCLAGSNESPGFMTLLFILCGLSCFVNPYGMAGLRLPFELFSRISPSAQNLYSLNISENVPLLSLTGFEAGYRVTVIVTVVIACVLLVANRKKARIAHCILFAGFSYLAYGAVRNVLLYVMIIIPILSLNIAGSGIISRLRGLSKKTVRFLQFGTLCTAIAVLAVPVMNHRAVVAVYPPHRSLSPFRFPEKITDYLMANPVPGKMFNDMRYGGYLIWHLYPQKQVFIDGRLVIRGPEFFAEYLAICEHPELFPLVAKKFDITFAILSSAIFDRYRKLIGWLYKSDEWRLEYTDGTSYLFVRNDASHRPAVILSDLSKVKEIAGRIRAEWRDAPYVRREALGYFADMLDYIGLNESAQLARKIQVTDSSMQEPR